MAAHQGQPVCGLTSSAHDDAADAAHEADRQVDLAEQQGEDLAHGQQHEDRALDQQVDQVAGGEEVRVQGLEDDRDEEQADDDRQHAALAAPQPDHQRPDVVAEACWPAISGRRPARPGRGRLVWRRRRRARPAVPSAAAVERVAGSAAVDSGSSVGASLRPPSVGPARRAGARGRVTSRVEVPVVMRSTTIWRSNSAAGPCGHHAPEVQHRDAVGDLEDVVQVVAR